MEIKHEVLELGKKYKQVVFAHGIYDIAYLDNVEVVKITQKSYMAFEWGTGKTHRIPKDSIFEARILENQ